MTLYLKFADGLYLNELTVKTDRPSETVKPVNHLVIIDRSGSMSWDLPKLIEDLKKHIRSFNPEDHLSVGWFSGQGQYRFVFKGVSLATEADFKAIDSKLEEMKRSVGLTCFSEILQDCFEVIDDLKSFSPLFSLHLFTDGYPVVQDVRAEEDIVLKLLSKLSGQLVGALFVGYGDYYNRELMAQMAQVSGGQLRHCSELNDYSRAFAEFVSGMPRTPKQSIHVPEGAQMVFTLHDGVVSYEVTPGGIVEVVSPAGDEFKVYLVTDRPNAVDSFAKPWQFDRDEDFPAAYAAAAMYSRMGRADLALQLMGAVGDVHFVNQIDKSFTLAELGAIEGELVDTARALLRTYRDGYKPGALPKADAYCVLNLLDDLLEIEGVRFYPYHPDFKYRRTSSKKVPVEGYPKFEPSVLDDEAPKLSGLVWDSKTLTVGGLVRIPGTIELGEEAAEYDLPSTYSTHLFRNYSIIKDGRVWTTHLPISLPAPSAQELLNKGAKLTNVTSNGTTVWATVDLSALPLINRSIAERVATDSAADDLASSAVRLVELGAETKVYKYLLEQLAPGKLREMEGVTPEQEEFLKSKGVTRNGFNPPTQEVEGENDQYVAKTVELKVKGLASFPKVEELLAKRAEGKITTPSLKAMATAVDEFESRCSHCSDEVKIGWLEAQVKAGQQQSRRLRAEQARMKASLLLGKRWFPGVPREDSVALSPTVTLVQGEKLVEI